MEVSLYHRLLRVSALTLSLILIFVSGIISPVTQELSENTSSYLASAIGMQASVQPTEINTITARLTERERDLEAREAALVEREIAVDVGGAGAGDIDYTTLILSTILAVLLALIMLNYVLDYRRGLLFARRVPS